MPDATAQPAPPVVGWVGQEAVGWDAFVPHWQALTGSVVGRRLGLCDADLGPAGPEPVGPAGDAHRGAAVRTWAARSLLLDRLAVSEAARLGVARLSDPDEWARRLEAAGEVTVPWPSERDVRACYRANAHRFRVAEARRVRHVVVGSDAEARRLQEMLPGPQALATVAHMSTDAGTRDGGGDLGWVERGQLAGDLETAIFTAAPGAWAGPVRSPFGWHLLVVEEVRPERELSLAECRDELEAEMAQDRRRTAWRRWWDSKVAEAVTVPPGQEAVLSPVLPGTGHRH